jgi:hypothetical protein
MFPLKVRFLHRALAAKRTEAREGMHWGCMTTMICTNADKSQQGVRH